LVSEVENVRLEIENRASELKHLIGNVAHDLKTVSFSCFSLLLVPYLWFHSPSLR
jgi:hypothetical protein